MNFAQKKDRFFFIALYFFVYFLSFLESYASFPEPAKTFHDISKLEHVQVTDNIALRISYTAARAPTRKVVIFCPGRASYIEKNAGFILAITGHNTDASHGYEFKNQVDFWCLDIRAQGGSGGRVLDENGQPTQRGHIDNFDDYVSDLHAVITTKILPTYKDMNVEFYLMGSSLGGHIILRFLQNYKDNLPMSIKRALAIVPMVEMDTSPWPTLVADSLVTAATSFGYGDNYAIGYGDSKFDNPDFSRFKGHHNEEEFFKTNAIMKSNPSLITGGPTNAWVKAAFESQKLLWSKPYPETVPVTFFLAGQDRAVITEASQNLAKEKGFSLFLYEKSLHNILKETAEASGTFWQDLDTNLN